MVTAWFEGNEYRGATRFPPGRTQRMYLGMWLTGSLVPTFAYGNTFIDEHTSDARVRVCRVETTPRQPQGMRHMCFI